MTALDFAQPAWQIVAVIFFLVPGLNCTWAIERIAGRNLIGTTERLVRAVAWSVFIYVIASPWLLSVADRVRNSARVAPAELIVVGFFLVLVMPFVVGVGAGVLRRAVPLQAALGRITSISPVPIAWDFAFAGGGPYFVRVSLRDGRRVAGSYADGSFAGTFPSPRISSWSRLGS